MAEDNAKVDANYIANDEPWTCFPQYSVSIQIRPRVSLLVGGGGGMKV